MFMSNRSHPGLHNLLGSWLTLVGGIAVLALLTLASSRQFLTNRSLDSELTGLRESVESLKVENLERTALIDYLNSQAYIEEKARIELGLKKADERLLVVTNNDGVDLPGLVLGVDNESQLNSNIEKWVKHFSRFEL
ncbi:hypothetical protein CL622_05905 [archaeon]|nr:hypothetical protein [archaeon]